MITEEQISELLSELYELEPQLKEREAEIRSVIVELISSKPDTGFDPEFAQTLKQEILRRINLAIPKKSFFNQSLISKLTFMKKLNYALAGVAALALIVGGFLAGQKQEQKKLANTTATQQQSVTQNPAALEPVGSPEVQKTISQVKKFASAEEFKNYLANAQSIGYGYGLGGGGGVMEKDMSAPAGLGAGETNSLAMPVPAAPSADRVSETNVQVMGIDEPDIVKTDGQNLYVSLNRPYVYYDVKPMEVPAPQSDIAPDGIMPPYRPPVQNTNIVAALPPTALKKIGSIDKQGNLLLYKDTLVIFTDDSAIGYNIKDSANPTQAWKIKYENNNRLTAARLYNGKLYLVTQSYPDFNKPCPLAPLSLNDNKITIPCTLIYHPVVPVSDVVTYSAFVVDPQSGAVKNQLAFVGSSGQAVVYMSPNALFLTYTYQEDQVKIAFDFFQTNGSGILPQDVMAKIQKLNGYDLSLSAKMVEFQQILQRFMSGLDNDAQTKLQNDLQNKLVDYLGVHKRDLQFTGVVKIPLDKFEVAATGNVPGVPLNQFSMDEYNGNLRVATNIATAGIGGLGGWNNQNSVNDVYVLDGNLKTIGKVLDLGQGERIYSVRFIDGQGFVVTFKQMDPFYVLDLSDPKNPSKKGELKIPGYSSYLHPLAQNRILGVGQESGKVKLSLFDVSDPANPKELDKYQLDEYWTDVSNNHHAFLQDAKHGVFFLPGGSSGYIFSYTNDRLALQKAVSQIQQVQRAVYINDAMYIVGASNIVVVDEKTWERIGELEL
jgi:uncharacterized secreted protein with C-terminal beta-propeller domain